MTIENFPTAVFCGENLSCRRGGRSVFTGLSFRVTSGEALVLRGPNGSGKTTLLRLMAGLARTASGTLTWNSGDIRDDGPAHGARLGFAGHLDAVKPALTVQENLSFWAELRGANQADVTQALEIFSMAHLANLPGRVLSAGQKHRVALARLLLGNTQLWLLDEPANTLDDIALNALRNVLGEHLQRGGIAVIASHGDALLAQANTLDLRHFIQNKPIMAAA
ncbi:MAG: heme ABC exporter ATP-binding protein CcmA [Rhodospirillaceae bacterium]|nr:heme ABC exporter ATP-binding protein CcmA [Rhodospirillaceae bacterium]